jgi:hypothetical protein
VGGTTVVTLAVGGSPYLTDDSSAPKLAEAIAAAAARMTHAEAVANLAGNRNWWRSFWARGATVSLPSRPRIESFYYSSHYLLATASSAIANATAPGLWGPWVTTGECAVTNLRYVSKKSLSPSDCECCDVQTTRCGAAGLHSISEWAVAVVKSAC